MGLFGSSDPAVQQEKLIEKEAKGEEKNLKHVIKEVSKAEKDAHKAAKAESHSHHVLEKAAKEEEKIASKLNNITHKHDSAVSKQNAAANELKAKEDAKQRAEATLQQKKAQLDELQRSHSTNEAVRAEKLNELHKPAQGNALRDGALDQHYAQQGHGGSGPNSTASPVGTVGSTNASNVGVAGQQHPTSAPVDNSFAQQPAGVHQPPVAQQHDPSFAHANQPPAFGNNASIGGQQNFAGVGSGAPPTHPVEGNRAL